MSLITDFLPQYRELNVLFANVENSDKLVQPILLGLQFPKDTSVM